MSTDFGFEEFWHSIEAPYCVVYRMYDAEHNLLYVGFTGRLKRRMREHYRDKAWVRERVEHVEVDGGYTEAEARRLEAELIEKYEPPYNRSFPSAPEGEQLPYIPPAARNGKWWLAPTRFTMPCDGCDEMISDRHAVRYLKGKKGGVGVYVPERGTFVSEQWRVRGRCRACGTETTRVLDYLDFRNALGFEPPPYRWRLADDVAQD